MLQSGNVDVNDLTARPPWQLDPELGDLSAVEQLIDTCPGRPNERSEWIWYFLDAEPGAAECHLDGSSHYRVAAACRSLLRELRDPELLIWQTPCETLGDDGGSFETAANVELAELGIRYQQELQSITVHDLQTEMIWAFERLGAGSERTRADRTLGQAANHTANRKRYTRPGGADEKILAVLCKHHQYESDLGFNYDPIGSNALARLADVGTGSVTNFMKRHFKPSEGERPSVAYCRMCQNESIKFKLQLLNGDPENVVLQYIDAIHSPAEDTAAEPKGGFVMQKGWG